MTSPIFIVGANRSGTTLLRLMLNAHGRIAVPDELVYFRSGLAGARRAEWARPSLSSAAFRDLVRSFLRRNRDMLAPLSVDDLEEQICSAGPPDLRRPYQYALAAWARVHGKERWGEKTPGNLFYADVIIDMFPDAKFIYLARDPRAGVYSMLRTPIFRGDAVINALNRRKYDTRGLAHLKRAVPSQQWTILRYEDLVSHPTPTLRELCAFLDEPFDPAMLSFHEDAEQFMKPRAVTQLNQAATRPVAPQKAERWRTGLSATQVAEIEWICGGVMEALGYQRDAVRLPLRRRALGWLKMAYWYVQDWRRRHAPQSVQQDRILHRTRNRLNALLKTLHRVVTRPAS